MKLYIMRHGPAEDRAPSGSDGDRALTPSGRDRVHDVAKKLVEADEAPNLILTSPLVRALQTAEIVAAVTKLEERGGTVQTRREIAPAGPARALVDALLADEKKRVMLVGHEPDLSELVQNLVGRVPPLGMQKAMVVGISVRATERPRLRFILDPKSLDWVVDARRTSARGPS